MEAHLHIRKYHGNTLIFGTQFFLPFHECGLEEYIFLMLSSIQYDDVDYYCKAVGAACPGVALYGNDRLQG